MWSMLASRAAARIRAGSRPPRPPYPASINSDSLAAVTMRVDSPPSTSMKNMSSDFADGERISARLTTAAITRAVTALPLVSWFVQVLTVEHAFDQLTATAEIGHEGKDLGARPMNI